MPRPHPARARTKLAPLRPAAGFDRLTLRCCSRGCFAWLLSSPTRLAFGSVLRSSAASSFCRFSGFTSLHALSTAATPIASAAVASNDARAPTGAAELHAFTVDEVVVFVKELRVSQVQADKLAAQEVDGAALLEMSVDELCGRCGLSAGAAHTIMRGIASAVAEVRTAAAAASAITLKVYPPLKEGRRNNHVKMTMTPDDFRIKFVLSAAPLQLVSKDGAVIKELFTLKEAVEATREPTVFLRWTRSFGDHLR